MNVQRRATRQYPATLESTQTHVEARTGHERPRIGQPIASRQRRPLDAHQVQRASLPRPTHTGFAILRVDAAHPHQRAGRHHGERVTDLHAACTRSTGCYGPAPRQREDAIDRHSKQTILGVLRPVAADRLQMRAQCRDTGITEHGGSEGKERRCDSGVGASSASTCSCTARMRASSTRSILVKATAPCVIPRARGSPDAHASAASRHRRPR